MASLYGTVWGTAGSVAEGDMMQYLTPVTIGATSTQSEAITGSNRRRRKVRLFADVDCFVTWGEDPTVTDGSDGIPLGADNPEYFDIEAGHKIAVITRT